MKELRRKLYDELKSWADGTYKEAIQINGARQVGKTTLAKRFLDENYKVHYVLDFIEHPEYKRIFEGTADIDKIIFRMSTVIEDFDPIPGDCAFLLDEIQECPEARTSLKYFVLDGRFRVIATGSFLGLMNIDSSNPVGFVRELELRSLDFEEFLWAKGISENATGSIRATIRDREPFDEATLDSLSKHFLTFGIVGGMPEVVSDYLEYGTVGRIRSTQKKIVKEYREDIQRYAPAKDRDKIASVLDSIPSQLSEESKKFRYSRLESNFVPTFGTYELGINWMCGAGMTERCTNLSAPKLYFEEYEDRKMFKLYMRDNGLLMSMFGPEASKALISGDTRVNKGAIMENLISECLSKCGKKLHYFTTGTMEIDFIVSIGMSVVAVEVKSGNNKKSKSLKSMKDNYGVKRRMKFENGNVWVDDEGVEHYPLFVAAFFDELGPRADIDLEADSDELEKRLNPTTAEL